MTKRPFRFTFFLLMCLLIPLTATAQTVNIPDANLRAAIESALGKTPGATITVSDMSGLPRLVAPNASISDLTGLEHATNLTVLNLGGEVLEERRINSNSITDLSSLRRLINLTELFLDGNSITDITSLGGLTNLTWLFLADNNISNITSLGGLTNLTLLALEGNSITDITSLGGLTNLIALDLSGNTISNITSLGGLTNLIGLRVGNNSITDITSLGRLTNLVGLSLGDNTVSNITSLGRLTNVVGLNLEGNSIADISPLVTNTGLGSGDFVDVKGNPLSSISINTHIPVLQEKGVEVMFDHRTPQKIRIVSGDNQQGLSGAVLTNPFIVEVRDQYDKPFQEVEVKFSVTGGGGTLSATTTATDNNGRAESTLTLGPNPGTNTVTVSVTGIQEKQTFNAEGIRIPETLDIVSGNDQEGLPGAALENPFVVEVRDRFDNPFSGAQVTFAVTSGGGRLSVSTATTDSDGRAESTLTLGPNPGANTVTVSVTGIQAQQTFNAEGIRIPLAFWIISGFDQKGVIGEALPKPIVVEMRDQSGEPLPGAQVTFAVTSGGGTLSVTSTTTDSDGRAESILTLGPDPGTNTVEVAVTGIQGKQTVTAIAELPPIPQDVNRDDVVNILDLVFVASALGDEGQGLVADVNEDGIVNILDLVMVAGALGNAAAAPSADPRALAMLTATDVGQWLAQAGELDLADATSSQGLVFLKQLLAALTPADTALMPNYPNPFNPETWIPYRLAEDAGVTLTIYDTNGALVRRLDVGHRSAGFYESRSEAIYWDSRNDFGEGVVSGVYFYHLSADGYSATRKMLIIK